VLVGVAYLMGYVKAEPWRRSAVDAARERSPTPDGPRPPLGGGASARATVQEAVGGLRSGA
jgi:hypothetical protein